MPAMAALAESPCIAEAALPARLLATWQGAATRGHSMASMTAADLMLESERRRSRLVRFDCSSSEPRREWNFAGGRPRGPSLSQGFSLFPPGERPGKGRRPPRRAADFAEISFFRTSCISTARSEIDRHTSRRLLRTHQKMMTRTNSATNERRRRIIIVAQQQREMNHCVIRHTGCGLGNDPPHQQRRGHYVGLLTKASQLTIEFRSSVSRLLRGPRGIPTHPDAVPHPRPERGDAPPREWRSLLSGFSKKCRQSSAGPIRRRLAEGIFQSPDLGGRAPTRLHECQRHP